MSLFSSTTQNADRTVTYRTRRGTGTLRADTGGFAEGYPRPVRCRCGVPLAGVEITLVGEPPLTGRGGWFLSDASAGRDVRGLRPSEIVHLPCGCVFAADGRPAGRR